MSTLFWLILPSFIAYSSARIVYGCKIDYMCFYYAVDSGLKDVSPSCTFHSISCDECIQRCKQMQAWEYPSTCKSAVYDCDSHTCDIFNVDDRMYGRLTYCPRAVYFRPTWIPQCVPSYAIPTTAASSTSATTTSATVTSTTTTGTDETTVSTSAAAGGVTTQETSEGSTVETSAASTETTSEAGTGTGEVTTVVTSEPVTTTGIGGLPTLSTLGHIGGLSAAPPVLSKHREAMKHKKEKSELNLDSPVNQGEWSLWSPCFPGKSEYTYRYRQCSKRDPRQCQKERAPCNQTRLDGESGNVKNQSIKFQPQFKTRYTRRIRLKRMIADLIRKWD